MTKMMHWLAVQEKSQRKIVLFTKANLCTIQENLLFWSVKGEKPEKAIEAPLETLAKNGTDKDGNTFLFAVGDGNHSLATAKAVWDEHKKTLSDSEKETRSVRFATELTDLAIAALQPVLDKYLDANSKDKKNDIDYIHRTDDVVNLGKKPNALSILLPPIAKDSFFQTVNERGLSHANHSAWVKPVKNASIFGSA